MTPAILYSLEMIRNKISRLLPRGGHDDVNQTASANHGQVNWEIYTYGLNGVDNGENILLRYG